MIHTGQTHQAWQQGPVMIRALRSLPPQAVEAVENAIGNLPGGWTLEPHDDYEGYLSVLISSEDDSNAPTYLISGQLGEIELAQLDGDELQTVGRFEHIEAAIAELVTAISRGK